MIAKLHDLELRFVQEQHRLDERIDKVRDHINENVGRAIILLLDKNGVQIDSQWKLVEKGKSSETPFTSGGVGHYA